MAEIVHTTPTRRRVHTRMYARRIRVRTLQSRRNHSAPGLRSPGLVLVFRLAPLRDGGSGRSQRKTRFRYAANSRLVHQARSVRRVECSGRSLVPIAASASRSGTPACRPAKPRPHYHILLSIGAVEVSVGWVLLRSWLDRKSVGVGKECRSRWSPYH